MSHQWMSRSWFVIVGALCLAFASSCGGGEETTQAGSSGSEATQGGEGEGGDGTATGIEQPPGSVEPEDNGAPAASTQNGSGSTAAGNQGSGAQSAAQLFGSADSDTGEPLPRRGQMNSQARTAYEQGLESANSGNLAGARESFESALEADPRAYKALYGLGVVADRLGNEGRAIEFYRRALAIQPDYELAVEGIVAINLRRGAVADALTFVEPLARRWVRNLAIQAIYADVLVHAERIEDAVTAARGALRRDERFVPAMIALAKANLQRGRSELAQSVLEQAGRIDDANAEIHYLKGRMQANDGHLGEAMTEFQRAVQLRPDYAEARVALGLQYLRGGNYPQAVSQFESAVTLTPTQPSVHLNLAEAYRASKQWARAKAEYDRVLQMEPSASEPHFNLGLLYLTAGTEFPGPDLLTGLQRAQSEFTTYRERMGARLARDDQSQTYLEDIARRIDREQKRLERDRARAEREKARQATQPAPAAPAAPPGGTQ